MHPERVALSCRAAASAAIVALLAACASVRPAEELGERRQLEEAGRPFVTRFAERALPELPAEATLEDVLSHAFLANAGLEQSWFEWSRALEREPQLAALDPPRLSFEYLFSREKMTSWDRATLGAEQMFRLPGKRELAAESALEEAVAARRRFEDANSRSRPRSRPRGTTSAWSTAGSRSRARTSACCAISPR